MFVYLAAPIDLASSRGMRLKHEVTAELRQAGFTFYDPSKPFGWGVESDAVMIHRVNERALQEADGGIFLLPEGVPSVGVPMEIQTKRDMGHPVVVVGATESMQLKALGVQCFHEDHFVEAVAWLKKRCTGRAGLRATARWIDSLRTAPLIPIGEAFPLPSTTEDGPFTTLKWVGDPECEPVKAYEGDAGYDLVVEHPMYVYPNEFIDVPMGISVQLPKGVWGMITGRSSTIRTRGLLVSQGIIDNGYRGLLFAGVTSLAKSRVDLQRGDRIAQFLLFNTVADAVTLERVPELDESDRGTNAFGSTGS